MVRLNGGISRSRLSYVFVDQRVHARRQRGIELHAVRGDLPVEALQDAVIDFSLVARVHLQLVLGIFDVARAEDVLEQKLLRAFAEVFELRGRDASAAPLRAACGRPRRAGGEEVAVEHRSRAGLGQELELALAVGRWLLADHLGQRPTANGRPHVQAAQERRLP